MMNKQQSLTSENPWSETREMHVLLSIKLTMAPSHTVLMA